MQEKISALLKFISRKSLFPILNVWLSFSILDLQGFRIVWT